jgi:hypothetical protein
MLRRFFLMRGPLGSYFLLLLQRERAREGGSGYTGTVLDIFRMWGLVEGGWWVCGYAGMWRVEVYRGLGGLIGGDRLGYGYGEG